VIFNITPQTERTLKVTVTRAHNLSSDYLQYLPSRTTCQVGWPPPGGEQALESKGLPPSLCITELSTIAKDYFMLRYGIPDKGDATISVYNILGARVWNVEQKSLLPGYYVQKINLEESPGGIYFVVLKQNDKQISRKFLLIK